jgi:hypothetical protein
MFAAIVGWSIGVDRSYLMEAFTAPLSMCPLVTGGRIFRPTNAVNEIVSMALQRSQAIQIHR